jgi:hypothetical protein
MEPLDRYLINSPGWDSERWRPRHGRQLGDFLKESVNRSGILEPIARVFAAHGFTFRLRGINRIDIRKLPAFHGARVPYYIWEMDFLRDKEIGDYRATPQHARHPAHVNMPSFDVLLAN